MTWLEEKDERMKETVFVHQQLLDPKLRGRLVSLTAEALPGFLPLLREKRVGCHRWGWETPPTHNTLLLFLYILFIITLLHLIDSKN